MYLWVLQLQHFHVFGMENKRIVFNERKLLSSVVLFDIKLDKVQEGWIILVVMIDRRNYI